MMTFYELELKRSCGVLRFSDGITDVLIHKGFSTILVWKNVAGMLL